MLKQTKIKNKALLKCSRVLLVLSVSSLTAACALNPITIEEESVTPLIELKTQPVHAQRLISQSVDQETSRQDRQQLKIDRRAAKIDRLALEVELLTLENQRIHQKMNYQKRYRRAIKIKTAAVAQVRKQNVYTPSLAMQEIQAKVAAEKQAINRVLDDLQEAGTSAVATPQLTGFAAQPQVPEESISVAKTALVYQPAPRNIFTTGTLHHTVYVQKNKQEWDDRWHQLQTAGVADKWRGYSSDRGIYFIYVGAYAQRRFAVRRQNDLAQRVGDSPSIISGTTKEKLAALVSLVNS